MEKFDVIIIGASAAGLMCASQAGKRGRTVLVLDHTNRAGKKILMSGGGRCNFTNYYVTPDNYISHNPHFCKSALSRYTQWNFIDLVKQYKIPFHEKALGQLFCDNKSKEILDMLLQECEKANASIRLNTTIDKIAKLSDHHYKITSSRGDFHCQSVVIATGGLSIPTMGATPFGYKIAEQFGINVWPTRAGLVPVTLHVDDKEQLAPLSGVSIDTVVHNQRQRFRESMLFTHRGLSGPSILQISSYWKAGEELVINMLPDVDFEEIFRIANKEQQLKTLLAEYLPKRVIEVLFKLELLSKKLKSIVPSEFREVLLQLTQWKIKPNGTEGYRTAEVTLGGVDCNAISSKTMEAIGIPGLYFIGEVLDVSGWLGGYNFQWAWSSGWAAGQVV